MRVSLVCGALFAATLGGCQAQYPEHGQAAACSLKVSPGGTPRTIGDRLRTFAQANGLRLRESDGAVRGFVLWNRDAEIIVLPVGASGAFDIRLYQEPNARAEVVEQLCGGLQDAMSPEGGLVEAGPEDDETNNVVP